IVEVAQGAEDFSTLVTAVTTADLAGVLGGEGPFTVFAPTNTAFEQVPAEDLEALLQPEQRDALQGLLTYHVVPGRIMAADVAAQAEANGGSVELTTVQGGTLTVSQSDGGMWMLTDEQGGT